ncbi:hypothetical protein [Actinoplanes derwentensis]|nr:hypothetical protein [Actinoplanes derwentensis]
MRKIAIVGNSGAGKTVLANRLGTLLEIPVTHLDALRYDPGLRRHPIRYLRLSSIWTG